MSLELTLKRTEQSIKSIQSLHFSKPGIFTNAIVKRPNITTLLKDPTEDEASLYKVTKPKTFRIRKSQYGRDEQVIEDKLDQDVRPERVDGKSIYVDQSFTQDEEQNQYEEIERKRLVVQVPELRNTAQRPVPVNMDPLCSSPTKRNRNQQGQQFQSDPTAVSSSYSFPEYESINDVTELCSVVVDHIRRYPTLVDNHKEVLAKVQQYQQDHADLSMELDDLKNSIEDQRKQLDILNINYSDIGSPTRSETVLRIDETDSDDELDIDEYIRQEELEIQVLEQQLNDRQGN